MRRLCLRSVRVLFMATLTGVSAAQSAPALAAQANVKKSPPAPAAQANARNTGRMQPTEAAPARVGPPSRQVGVSTESFATNRTRPVAANGYLIATSREFANDQRDRQGRIALTSLGTGLTEMLPFSIKGAQQIRLESSTVSVNQGIVVAGRYDDHNFIALVNHGGNITRLVDTGAYAAVRVCTAPDDSIWTFGQDSAAEIAQKDYAMVQHRSPKGEVLGQYLPNSSLHAKARMNYHAKTPQANAAYFACGATSVAAYVGNGGLAYIWFEIDTTTGTTYQTLVPRVPNTIMTGLYVAGLNRAYMSTPVGMFRLTTMDAAGVSSPISFWAPVVSSSGAPVLGTILGTDSGAAVHVSNLPITKAAAAAADAKAKTTVYATILQ
jgi:hypothetical protein